MTTEYRQNTPSVAHVEAATRLGLLWQSEVDRVWILQVDRGRIVSEWSEISDLADIARIVWPAHLEELGYHAMEYRPIHPDGTPVDWEVLDQEVARVGQQGQPATVTPTASTAPTPTTQPQGFRADLWRRIAPFYAGTGRTSLAGLEAPAGFWNPETDARWTVYQELKPLYDLVDGAQGEAAMPRDVEAEWDRQAGVAEARTDGDWSLHRNVNGFFAQSSDGTTWFGGDYRHAVPLRNFAAVLDAVAERRVAERMRGQTPANPDAVLTVTSAQPEPRRFADVRPDRHGWRWWRVWGSGCGGSDGARIEFDTHGAFRWSANTTTRFSDTQPHDRVWTTRTVIPTDEQGNPVSWESIGPTDLTEIRLSSPQEGSTLDFEQGVDMANRAMSQTLVAPLGPPPPVGEMTRGVASYDGPVLTIDSVSSGALYQETLDRTTIMAGSTLDFDQGMIEARARVTLPGLHDSMRALPRFGLIELDDDDRTGRSEAPGPALRSGTVPTAAQVAKFRGVLSRKLDNTLADAVKESGVSCEVSQHVLQRWAGGLGDEEAAEMIGIIVRFETSTKSAAEVNRHAEAILANWSPKFADLGGEPARPAPSRGELEERRRRLAELQARLRAERAERPAEELQEEPNRMALIEPDPAADPRASIRAWEERQEAAKAVVRLRPGLAVDSEREPPRGPAVELVDASYLGSWLGRLYALANTDLPDTRLGARLGPRQRASG